jgi:hypothetical protein
LTISRHSRDHRNRDSAGGRVGEVDVAQAEPLAGEVLRERGRLRAGEQTLDLLAENLPVGEIAREQFVVRRRAPKELRQAAGQQMVVEQTGLFQEKRNCGETRMPFRPTQTADSNEYFAAGFPSTCATNGAMSSSVAGRRKARVANSF